MNEDLDSKKPLRAAFYMAVGNRRDLPDLNRQQALLEDSALQHGWEVAERYVDVAGRESFRLLMSDARKGSWGVLLVEDFSVLGEGLAAILATLLEFSRHHILIASLTPSALATDGAAEDRCKVAWLSEALRLAERVKGNKCRARQQSFRASGGRIGRPRREVSASKLLELAARGLSIGSMSKAFAVSPATISRRLASLQIQLQAERVA